MIVWQVIFPYGFIQTKRDSHLPDSCYYKGNGPADSYPSPYFISILWFHPDIFAVSYPSVKQKLSW